MKGHGERARLLRQLTCTGDVNVSIDVEDAEHYAIGSELLRHLDVAAHGFKFIGLVTEISAARTDQDMQVHRDRRTRRLNQPSAGRDSALDQTATQFDASSSAANRCTCRGYRVDTHFNQDLGGRRHHDDFRTA